MGTQCPDLLVYKNIKCIVALISNNVLKYTSTRRSGHYAPILLAPAEGWGPFRPFWGPLAPSSVEESKSTLYDGCLDTLYSKIPSGFSYLTLYDSPKRPIGKSERGPKAPSVVSIRVWGRKGSHTPLQEQEGGWPQATQTFSKWFIPSAINSSSEGFD